ncbi:hypothetical protein Tco_0800372 [Tanacetum coccineum]|uniref:Reverse transcriptase domain-containing protein n=1 Tax=Tanacetum coccineum TaxID=301880 RepID=A0ABQ4ZSX8_9ASTR
MMTTTNSTTDSKMIIGVCKRSVEVSLRHCNIWALERTYSKVRNFRKGNCESNAIEPKEEVDIKKEVGYGTNNEPVRSLEEEITGDGIEELVEMPRLTKQKPIGTNINTLDPSHRYIFPLDKKKPFILGTPFLTTAKVEIRFDKGTITLKSGKNKINFFKIPESLCRVEEGTENDIDPAAPTTTVSRLILEWEERIKLHQEKEMEFN